MRLFIAIELSPQIRDTLAQIQSHLKYAAADVKWVEKDNIHLTLKFLGEIAEEKAEKIKAILDEIGSQIRPFEISLKEIGVFPKIEYPRIIWVGIDKGALEAKELAERIDGELSKIGFQLESRPFASHLTIGRVRSPKNREALIEKLKTAENSHLSASSHQQITSVILFQSALTPKGPIYTKLHKTAFSA